MMGFGCLANGGSSSSSSNLSALAPPFTIDRSNPKPNSNPLVHITGPPYAVPFQHSFNDWQYSHSSASRPDLFSNLDSEFGSIRTTGLTSVSDYDYLGPVSSPSAHMPSLNPNVSSATDAFTFLPYSSDIPSNCVKTKPYCCPPLVSPVVDDDIPLVALNETSYDLLSTSRVAPLGETSQVDYTRSLSGLEYTPPWGSFWSRLADGEQGKHVEVDGSFCLEEANDAGSYVYEKYMKQGACTADGSSKYEETSAASRRKCVDVLGRESYIVSSSMGKLNFKSSSLQDPISISGASQRKSISGMSSTPQESHAHIPSLESATNFWNHQMPYSTSHDSCINDCISVKKSSPALVIRPPSIDNGSTMPNPVSSEDVSSTGNVSAVNSTYFGCHDPFNQKGPFLPTSYGKEGCLDVSQPNLRVDRSDHVFVAQSSTRKEELPNAKDGLDHMSNAGMEFQLHDPNIPYGFSLALDSAKGFTSVEYSSESLDHYNPAVDSPCWKGTPSSCFSLSEAVTPQHLRKKLEACDSLYLQQTQISPPCADDTVKVSCQNLLESSVNHENGYVELDSLLCPEKLSNANCPTREHSSTDAVKAGFDYTKLSSSNGVQFSNDIDKPRKKYDVANDSSSDSDLKPSSTKQPDLDKGEFISEREFQLSVGVADPGLNTNDASEDGILPFHGVESTSCSPSAENVNKLAKLVAMESTPKMNANMLVDAIHNLSKLLLFQCSNDASAVSEQDHEALKHTINNLDACVSKKIVHMTPTRGSMFTEQCISHECRNLPDLHKSVVSGRLPVTKDAGVSSHGQFDYHSKPEGKRNRNVSGKEIDKFPDSVSLRGDGGIVKNDSTVQAIKEVLKEDFNGEEEMQSETLLYKNLWLEAEAALCSISYRARFNRMKIEMEKCKSYKAKGVAESTKAVDKLPNSKVSPAPNITHEEDNPLSDNDIQDSSISSSTKVVDDVEDSALARFHILKCRDENSKNCAITEEQQLTEVVGNGFAGGGSCWHQSEDGSLDVNVGPFTQDLSSNSIIERLGSFIGRSDSTEDLLLCPTTDNEAMQSHRSNRLGSRFPSGWYDSSSLDWEHVLKDEFAYPN